MCFLDIGYGDSGLFFGASGNVDFGMLRVEDSCELFAYTGVGSCYNVDLDSC